MPFLSPLSLAVIFLIWIAARLAPSVGIRNGLFLAASLLFYFSYGGWFLGILGLSALFNFFWGNLLRRNASTAALFAGIGANVALLGTFKYLPQIAGPWAGQSAAAAQIAGLALPVGISFWTFQGLSYLFDQYRGEELDPTFLEFCVYMSFAPTVLSGPICRVSELLPQLRTPTRAGWADLRAGAQQMWVGVWMISLARILGAGLHGDGVNWAFKQSNSWGFVDVWVLLLGYGFQIFFDFAGYTRLVIGLASVFGIQLPENFDHPFLAVTPTMFWQRWHMSLSFWIRDYLFMPLAMMRGEMWWRNAMLVFSMVVFGLWHKASWLFLLWGLYQGTLLFLHRMWQKYAKQRRIEVPDAASWLITFLVVTMGWILFRAQDLGQAGQLLRAATNPFVRSGLHLPAGFVLLVLLLAGGYFAWFGFCRARGQDQQPVSLQWIPLEARGAFYALTFYLAVFYRSSVEAFVYFQF